MSSLSGHCYCQIQHDTARQQADCLCSALCVGCFDSTDINVCSRDATLAPRALQLVPQTSSVTAHFNTGARLKIWQSAKRILTECYSEVNQRRIMYHLLSNKMHVTITHIVTVLMPRYVSVLQHRLQGTLKTQMPLGI